MSAKQEVIAFCEREGIELEYGYDRETKTWSIEVMTYGQPRMIDGCHSYIIDSSHADRKHHDSGEAKMVNGWKAILEILKSDWCLAPCPGCEGCE